MEDCLKCKEYRKIIDGMIDINKKLFENANKFDNLSREMLGLKKTNFKKVICRRGNDV